MQLLKTLITFISCIILITCEDTGDITSKGDGICSFSLTGTGLGPGATLEEICHSHSKGDNVCCFFELESTAGASVNDCIEIRKDHRFILDRLSTITIENKYNAVPIKKVDCLQIDKSCGVEAPEELYQCRKHSSTSKSCCKINFADTNKKSECALAQDKFGNETITTELLGVSVECVSLFLYQQSLLIIMIFLGIIA